MSDNDLAWFFPESSMRMFLHEPNSPFQLFSEAKEKYYQTVNRMKSKLKDVPLNFLIELSEQSSNYTKKTDADFVPEYQVSLSDTAKHEIHRRAFQGFATPSSTKRKIDSSQLGFLRKPKF